MYRNQALHLLLLGPDRYLVVQERIIWCSVSLALTPFFFFLAFNSIEQQQQPTNTHIQRRNEEEAKGREKKTGPAVFFPFFRDVPPRPSFHFFFLASFDCSNRILRDPPNKAHIFFCWFHNKNRVFISFILPCGPILLPFFEQPQDPFLEIVVLAGLHLGRSVLVVVLMHGLDRVVLANDQRLDFRKVIASSQANVLGE